MYRKYFFKSKGVLSRRFVASGLAAVFSAGMFGSYAGAMQSEQNITSLFPVNKVPELANVLNEDSIKEDDENAEKVFKFFINFSELPKPNLTAYLWKDNDKTNNDLLKNEDFLIRVYAYLLLLKFYKFKDEDKFSSIDDFLEKLKSTSLGYHFLGVSCLEDNDRTNLLNKIKGGWGNELLEKLKKEKHEQDNLKIVNTNLLNESINKHELDKNIKNKTKNKFRKTIIVVSVVIVLLAIIVTITLALKGKSNTGAHNNNNKNDEKINPSINPKSDDQNSQQNNQEERPSVVPSNILKVAGATVPAGMLAGGGTYLFNKVLKSGKPSEVKNLRNVDNKYMYLDSDGNKVTKTEEGRKDNYDNDDKNADNSDTNQLLEDKNAEKIEEGQEEILEKSALCDDTEATSDEEKNKD